MDGWINLRLDWMSDWETRGAVGDIPITKHKEPQKSISVIETMDLDRAVALPFGVRNALVSSKTAID
jgi:hypothetical protein